ncbi:MULTISPECIES: DUF2270 domain-containing protein [Halorussus]|uniref:DUF2270 domain-containing protein n=1 Tax=Halorussus TaxID=1070314 RepID=UPI00209F446C|nr:DUF2270 domain-containing protein [Halorussus vallis]USZ77356.1 DUF2270 domain-containing protein [Halorussus vallis]
MGDSGDAESDDRGEEGERDELPDDDPGDRLSEAIGETVASDPSDMLGLLGHFYRGQMDRVTAWRGRLDQTSYWAVTIIAAILTWVFSSPGNPHYLLLVAMGAMMVFLVIEARRYRAYDVWRERVRMLEEDLFAEMFDPDQERVHADWRTRLSADLRNPALKTSMLTALARRLRRIYYPLLLVLLAAWLTRITVFEPKQAWWQTARILGIPGSAVVAAVAAFYLAATALVGYEVIWGSADEFHEREEYDPWNE